MATPDHDRRSANLLICLVIAIAAIAIYAQTATFGFVHFDDTGDALNANIRRGLTFENLRWALTSGSGANWLPLTRFSHIVDFALYGPAAGPRHLENLLLHMFASIMVFLSLLRATGERWPSAFSGLLFAVHPLHVESVAWIAERKDVLSALLWFLTLWAWAGYTARPTRANYLKPLIFFGLGLMSKPMMVTLPAVLLLLDVWPFRRGISKKTLIEKVPFAVLAALGAAVTVIAQRAGGAVQSFSAIGPALRTENALRSWVIYLAKTIWPSRLAVWYPYPSGIDHWVAISSGTLLILISAAAFLLRRQLPYVTVGWFWYLITTLPVIGLIQVGSQAYADRYMYIPMVGPGIALAWGAADLIARVPAARIPILSAGAATLAGFTVLAYIQTGYWRDSQSLFGQALRVTENNYLAMQNLGSALAESGHKQEAIDAFRQAAATKPDAPGPHASLCGVLSDKQEALRECDLSIRLEAENWEAQNNRCAVLTSLGQVPESIAACRAAIRLKPAAAESHANLGMLLLKANDIPGTLAEEDRAIQLDSSLAPAHYTKGRALMQANRFDAAVEEFEETVRLQPNSAQAHGMLAAALSHVPWGIFDCFKEFQTALQLDPKLPDTHGNLALALSNAGRHEEALQQIRLTVQLEPGPTWANALAQIEAKSAAAH